MKIFIICICVIVALAGVIFLLRYFYNAYSLQKLKARKYAIIYPLLQKLIDGGAVSEAELFNIARDPSLRLTLFRTLEVFHCQHLFPAEFYNEEKGAEAYMVNWLEYPTELDNTPEEILLMKIVTLGTEQNTHYYVFKFRSHMLHWAARFNWMMGVCGPYNDTSLPFDIPFRVFSRFKPIETILPEEEVAWVHSHINNKLQ
jgi:hypothetical protein